MCEREREKGRERGRERGREVSEEVEERKVGEYGRERMGGRIGEKLKSV